MVFAKVYLGFFWVPLEFHSLTLYFAQITTARLLSPPCEVNQIQRQQASKQTQVFVVRL
jgi:hypothetical protein